MGIVAVAATAVAFSLSLASLRRITPTEFAVTSTLEPALAAVATVVFFGVTLRPPQYAGGALTIIAVLLLASADQRGCLILVRRQRRRASQVGRAGHAAQPDRSAPGSPGPRDATEQR